MDRIPDRAKEVLDFWATETAPEQWFRKDDAFDAVVRARFGTLHMQAAAGGLDDWARTAQGCLALVIVLDQFPRNLYRGDPRSFATDGAARRVLARALERGFDRTMTARERQFLYLPLQHSENVADQALSVRLNADLGEAGVLKYATAHKAIVDRFGRFPHRNAVLGRETTPEEAEFLAQPGSSF